MTENVVIKTLQKAKEDVIQRIDWLQLRKKDATYEIEETEKLLKEAVQEVFDLQEAIQKLRGPKIE